MKTAMVSPKVLYGQSLLTHKTNANRLENTDQPSNINDWHNCRKVALNILIFTFFTTQKLTKNYQVQNYLADAIGG